MSASLFEVPVLPSGFQFLTPSGNTIAADGHRVIPLILRIFAAPLPTLYTVATPGGPMKYTVFAILIVLALSLAVHSQQQPGKDLSWAFPVKNGDLPPEPAGAKSVPNSKKTYDQAQ